MSARPGLRRRLELECLEDRLAPASVRLIGGDLFIGNQTGSLLVRTTATPGDVEIIDNGQLVSVVGGVGGRITITGTNRSDVVTFQANASGFGGDLSIDVGNGNDTVVLQASAPAGIGGSVTVRPGLSSDTVAISAATRIDGSLQVIDSSGINAFVSPAALTVDGNLSVVGVTAFVSTVALSVAGDLSISPVPGSSNLGVTLNGVTTIGRNLSVTSTARSTGIAMLGTTTVNGNVNLRLGFANAVNVAPTVRFLGNLTVSGGPGLDAFTFLGIVGGDLSVSVGNGSNGTIVGGRVMGTVHYRGGNGSEALTIAPAVPATVVADVTFGSGTATFALIANATLTGRVRGNGGTYTLVQGGATLGPPLVFVNFP